MQTFERKKDNRKRKVNPKEDTHKKENLINMKIANPLLISQRVQLLHTYLAILDE